MHEIDAALESEIHQAIRRGQLESEFFIFHMKNQTYERYFRGKFTAAHPECVKGYTDWEPCAL